MTKGSLIVIHFSCLEWSWVRDDDSSSQISFSTTQECRLFVGWFNPMRLDLQWMSAVVSGWCEAIVITMANTKCFVMA
jgi:hypothetical protein